VNEKNRVYNLVIAENSPIVIQGLIGAFDNFSRLKIVGTAQSGNEIFELVDKFETNTIIMELNLSSTNIFRLIKDLVVTQPDIKLIALTNYNMPKLIQDVMEFGVHAFLSKSASIAEIKDSILRVHRGEQYICKSVYKRSGVTQNKELIGDLDQDFIKFSELTEREMDVVILVSKGFTNREMADKLNLSKFTIETHRRNLMNKLNLKTSGQLIFFASRQGLV